MKNVCIVGYGAIGPIHANALSKTNEARFYAVCDIDENKITLAKSKYDVVSYTDFDKMLTDKNIDSVHICTPHHLHLEMIQKSLSAGKSVVCEKPIAMTKSEFDKLLSLKDAENICTVLQNRLNPCIIKFKELAENGGLGKVKAVKGNLTWFRSKNYYEADAWRGKKATEGGGVMINQAIHTLDYYSYIGGEISSVCAKTANFAIPEIEVEDTCMVHLNLKCGARGSFFATNSYGENSSPEFEVSFENGAVCYKDSKLFLNNTLICEDIISNTETFYWGKGHELLIKNYYEKNLFFSPFDIKNTMDTLFAIYESEKNNGKEIVL